MRLAVVCLLAKGHLLIEDIPGVGKTTLSQALARSLGLQFRRIQFTSDLLPADIIGNSIFDREHGRFVFHPGPIFSPVVLIDEVNRATPKTQSALLEAMEEYQVSADGVTRALPQPFFVIATQNPRQQIGTFPLPESQLDRFLMRLELGFPTARASGRCSPAEPPRPAGRVAGGAQRRGTEATSSDRSRERPRVARRARLPAGFAGSQPPRTRHRPVAARGLVAAARRAGLRADAGPRHGLARRYPGGGRTRDGAPAGGRCGAGQLGGRELARHLIETVPVG